MIDLRPQSTEQGGAFMIAAISARRRDPMRCFAWLCVVAGVVIGSISISDAIHETTMREAVWIQRELSGQNAARLSQLIRDIDLGVRPAGVIVSPWPGGLAGAGVMAFGALILAIRRRPQLEGLGTKERA